MFQQNLSQTHPLVQQTSKWTTFIVQEVWYVFSKLITIKLARLFIPRKSESGVGPWGEGGVSGTK